MIQQAITDPDADFHDFHDFSNKSRTLPFENRKNISCIALSPDGNVLISIDEGGFHSFFQLPPPPLVHPSNSISSTAKRLTYFLSQMGELC